MGCPVSHGVGWGCIFLETKIFRFCFKNGGKKLPPEMIPNKAKVSDFFPLTPSSPEWHACILIPARGIVYFGIKSDKFRGSNYNLKNRSDDAICIPPNYSK